MPKAVSRKGRRNKHKRPRRDSNLGPLTPQSDALTTRLLRPMAANYAPGAKSANLDETRLFVASGRAVRIGRNVSRIILTVFYP